MSERVEVRFLMWGQLATTYFDNEQRAWEWLSICYDKGWLSPKEMLVGSKIIVASEILDKIGEK